VVVTRLSHCPSLVALSPAAALMSAPLPCTTPFRSTVSSALCCSIPSRMLCRRSSSSCVCCSCCASSGSCTCSLLEKKDRRNSRRDRKSTRPDPSHVSTSYAVPRCQKKNRQTYL